jgi:hypothetical protein
MTNFEEYKKDNDIWFSPHFYTHPNGYKMCLGVVANFVTDRVMGVAVAYPGFEGGRC